MKIREACVLALSIGLLAFSFTVPDLNGVWKGHVTDSEGNQHELTLNLKADGDKLISMPTWRIRGAFVNDKLISSSPQRRQFQHADCPFAMLPRYCPWRAHIMKHPNCR